jgi:hypothetical protein
MTELFAFLIIGGTLALLWRSAEEARAIALDAASRACRDAHVQLLDGAVVFKSWQWVPTRRGRSLKRTYLFDYCDDGSTRRQGFVILEGRTVEIIGLGPTLLQDTVH